MDVFGGGEAAQSPQSPFACLYCGVAPSPSSSQQPVVAGGAVPEFALPAGRNGS
jgi:hypothetical protein